MGMSCAKESFAINNKKRGRCFMIRLFIFHRVVQSFCVIPKHEESQRFFTPHCSAVAPQCSVLNDRKTLYFSFMSFKIFVSFRGTRNLRDSSLRLVPLWLHNAPF